MGISFAHSPHDVIQILEISPTYEKDKTLFVKVQGPPNLTNMLLKSTDGGFSWKWIGNGLDNKCSFSSLAFSPSFHFDKTLFISSKGDGIYKSKDGGSSWSKVNNGLGNLSIRLVAASPDYHSDKIVLAAGTEGGLYKSRTEGESWYQVIDNSIKLTTIAYFSGLKKGHMLVGDHKGALYFSSDGGENWRQYFRIPNCGGITSIAVSPNVSSDNTWFVGTEKRGVYKTVDGGASFIAVNNGLSERQLTITSLVISPDYKKTSTIFASTWYEAVFRSDDGGKTWKKYSTGITTDRQADEFKVPHFMDLRISRTFGKDKTFFLAGFDGLFKSTDGGTVWAQMETMSAKPIVCLAISPGYREDSTVAIATSFGGAYITHDKGATWEVINRGLNRAHLWNIAVSPNFSLDNTIFATDNYVFYKSTDGGNNWITNNFRHRGRIESIIHKLSSINIINKLLRKLKLLKINKITFPWSIAISPDFAHDSTIYVGTRYEGVFRSVDGGVNWSQIWNANWSRARSRCVGLITSLVISPDFSSDRTLYAGVLGEGIYKTVDGGETWQTVNNGLTRFAKRYILDPLPPFLAISPNYKIDKTVFAGTAEGLFKTVDGGKQWQKLEGSAYDGNGYVIGIAMSPNYQNDRTLIISVRGKGLFKTVDGGAAFVKIGHDLINNNHFLRLIEFSPAYFIDNTIFGAREELFQSTDGGNTWNLITRPTRYEDKLEVVNYQGEWEVSKDKDFSLKSIRRSNVARNQAILNFVGTGVSWIGTESNNQGIAKVYIDGDLEVYVDQFSDTRNVMVRQYSIADLDYGPHTIMIEVTDTKNPESTGYWIEIDAFDIEP